MALSESNLVSLMMSIPNTFSPTSALWATNFGTAYNTYALTCETGMPLSPVTRVVPISLVPATIITPLSTLVPSDTAEADFVTALYDSITAYWVPATFALPSTITAAVVLPPEKLNVILPGETVSTEETLKSVIANVFLKKKDGTFISQMELLAKILHACTKIGTTSGTNAVVPASPYIFAGILGDIGDTLPLDLSLLTGVN